MSRELIQNSAAAQGLTEGLTYCCNLLPSSCRGDAFQHAQRLAWLPHSLVSCTPPSLTHFIYDDQAGGRVGL